jgi:Zn-dependent alcohol dehydrogenase
MKSIAAVYLKKNKPIVMDEIKILDPNPDQVIIKMYASGICNSQLFNLSRNPLKPELLGHEGTGVIIKKGKKVKHLKEGDDVLISWMPNKFNENTKYLEWSKFEYKKKKLFSVIYTWSEYALLHNQFVSKLPKYIDKYQASIIGCAGIAGYGTVLKNVKKNTEAVAIIGAGGLGLLGVNAAKNLKVKKIIVIDISDEKLKFSKKFGATHVLNINKTKNLTDLIYKMTSKKGVDYTFDMVGNEQTQNLSIYITKSGVPGYSLGGKIFFTGFPKKKSLIDTRNVLMGQKTIIGSRGGGVVPKVDFAKFYKDIKNKKFYLNKVVTNVYKLSEVNEALNNLKNQKILGRSIIKIS